MSIGTSGLVEHHWQRGSTRVSLADDGVDRHEDWLLGRYAEDPGGQRHASGVPSASVETLKALERKNRDVRQANEIPGKASAYFAMAELDRWPT